MSEFARLLEVKEVKRSTLPSAWTKLQQLQSNHEGDDENFASNLAHHRIEGRGRHTNRALTDEEELAVIAQLKENYPHGFNDEDIRRLCHSAQRELRSKPSSVYTSLHGSNIDMVSLGRGLRAVPARWPRRR